MQYSSQNRANTCSPFPNCSRLIGYSLSTWTTDQKISKSCVGHLPACMCLWDTWFWSMKLYLWSSCSSHWQILNRNLSVWLHSTLVSRWHIGLLIIFPTLINLSHKKQSAGSRRHCGNIWAKTWVLKDFPLQILWTVLTWNCYISVNLENNSSSGRTVQKDPDRSDLLPTWKL